jgi:tetratricopeptide (TPR) repeat protein
MLSPMIAFPKAFLSHSSHDKAMVEPIAAILGRARVVYDLHSFEPGEDFRDAIRSGLDESKVFVFIVSRSALDSVWCRFEVDEAELRLIQGTLHSALVVIIDDDVQIHDLPEWMRRIKAVRAPTSRQAARMIESRIDAILPEDLKRPFVNRIRDIERGQRKLMLDEPPPRILVVSGLEGVGRRSYIRRLVLDVLKLEMSPTFVIEPSHTLEDLYVVAGEEALPPISREELAAELAAFRLLDDQAQADETAGRILLLSEARQMCCLLDRGGMLNSRGVYHPHFRLLIEAFLESGGRDTYLAIAHNRAPDLSSPFNPPAFERRLRPLEPVDAQVLLSQLLRDAGVDRSKDSLQSVAEATGGYPPAVYFAASQIENYGLHIVANDHSMLTNFHVGNFRGFLEQLDLSEDEAIVLEYLGSQTALPARAIAIATDIPPDAIGLTISKLIDRNLVESIDDEYTITAPIRTAVVRGFERLDNDWYQGAFKRFEETYWADDNVAPPISVVDATLRTALRIGRHGIDNYGDIVRPSLLVRGAEEMYHNRQYDLALEYAERAEVMGARSAPLDEVVIKSLAQLSRIGEARSRLREYQSRDDRRYWYLRGFVARKDGNFEEACEVFQTGYSKGDRSISLLRDYADSLYRLNQTDAALRMAETALERRRANEFVLDLIARIKIDHGTDEEALAALDALEEVAYAARSYTCDGRCTCYGEGTRASLR